MSKWKNKQLSQLASLQKGLQMSKILLGKEGDYYVLNGGRLPSGYLDRWNTEENTISISEGGNSCGYVAFNREKFWSGGHNYTLKFLLPEIRLAYLYHFLKYKEPEIMRLRVGSGLPNVQKKELSKVKVDYSTNTAEQDKIAEILTVIDEAIEKTEALIEKYCAIKEGMMQDLLTNGIDEHGKIRSPQTHKYKPSPLGNIPVEWDCLQIKKVMPLQRGFDLPIDKVMPGNYPIAYSNGITGYHKDYKVKGPCVWTGRSGTIGNVFYTESDCWVHNTSLWVTAFHGNNAKFIFYLLSFCDLQKFSAGTGVPTLNRNDVHIQYVALPKNSNGRYKEQDEIVKRLDAINNMIIREELYLSKLQQQKQGLMQDLLTHNVAVDALL